MAAHGRFGCNDIVFGRRSQRNCLSLGLVVSAFAIAHLHRQATIIACEVSSAIEQCASQTVASNQFSLDWNLQINL